MSDAADQRFAPPQAHVEDLATDGIVLAGRGARFVAAMVDTVIGVGVGWGMMQIPVLAPMVKAQTAASGGSMWAFTPLSMVVGLLSFYIVQTWSLLARGQTLGKMLLKLRIVRSDGSKADAWRLLGLRYGIGGLANVIPGIAMIFGLIDALLIFRASRQCLHDSIADTKVIKL